MSDEQQKEQPQPVNETPTPTDIDPSKNRGQQSFVKRQTIKILRATIEQLESLVENLETKPTSPVSVAPEETFDFEFEETETPIAEVPPEQTAPISPPEIEQPIPPVTEALETPPVEEEIEAVAPPPAVVSEAPSEPIETLEQPSWLDRVLPSFRSLQAWWDGVLAKVRTILPTAISDKLSDWAITGILSSLVVVVLLTGVILFPQTPSETEVAQKPIPIPKPIEAPPELTAPKEPKPVETVPIPEPELALTPEQGLIAAIQNQVGEITNQYAEGLIQSIEANFRGSRLSVTVGNDWYNFQPSEQDKLANDMLRRSKELDFSNLEIQDSEGNLVARTPVVGDKMVILQREKLTALTPSS
ncbi:MAG: hypothetical protein ACOC3E_01600 [Cyanobacteriota bacterium]